VAAATAAAPRPARAPKRSNPRWGSVAAICIALAVLVALIVALLANSDFGDEGAATPTADVPNVIGRNYTQAEADLKERGFEVVRHDDDQRGPDGIALDVTQPPDVVLGQDPEEGRKFPKGGRITLTVSKATITMPNVLGQNRLQATQTLAKSNLTGNFVEEDSDQPPGTLLRTDPAAGGTIAKLPFGGRPTVTVVLAREPKIPVPDVNGQDPYAATANLGAAGFQVSPTVVQAPSDTVPKNMVIGTDPPAGTPLQRGTEVKLVISTGPNVIDVPNMVGKTRAEAEAVLNGQLGFGLTINLVNGGAARAGKVISQNPAGGQLPKGATITLVVGI
jgi:serine/threonine-protein kinase